MPERPPIALVKASYYYTFERSSVVLEKASYQTRKAFYYPRKGLLLHSIYLQLVSSNQYVSMKLDQWLEEGMLVSGEIVSHFTTRMFLFLAA